MSPNWRTSSSSPVRADWRTDASRLLRHSRYITGAHRLINRKTIADRRIEITTNTTTTSWIRRVAAGAVLAAAPALIALGTATASHAAETNSTSPSYSPTPIQTAHPYQGAEDGSVALPPGGPIAIYPQGQSIGGANPYTPFGTNPYVPHGVWTP
jgi:hypothetical protein